MKKPIGFKDTETIDKFKLFNSGLLLRGDFD